MSERKLHHLFNLGQLLPTASDVVVADVIKALLLILSQGDMQDSHLVGFVLSHECGMHSLAQFLMPIRCTLNHPNWMTLLKFLLQHCYVQRIYGSLLPGFISRFPCTINRPIKTYYHLATVM